MVGGKAKGNKEPKGSEDDSHGIRTSEREGSIFRSPEKGPFSGEGSRLGVREPGNFFDGEIVLAKYFPTSESSNHLAQRHFSFSSPSNALLVFTKELNSLI